MKINLNFLYGAFIGAFLMLLTLYLLKPDFVSKNITQSNDIKNIKSVEQYHHDYDADEAQNNVNDSPFSSEATQEKCTQECVNKIISDMVSGENLGNNFGISISDQEAIETAKHLTNKPNTITAIRKTLSKLNGQDARDTILFALSHLPSEQLNDTINYLKNSKNKKDRADALSFIYTTANKITGAEDSLKERIKLESDPSIALNAIAALYSLDKNSVGNLSRRRLTELLKDPELNPEIRANSLVTKSRLFEINNDIRMDIIFALTSPIEEFQQAGIQVLDQILSKQSTGNAAGNWLNNTELKELVESIANDKKMNSFSRVEALNLIRRHYDN